MYNRKAPGSRFIFPILGAHFIFKWVKFGLIQKNKALQNAWKACKINAFISPNSSSSGIFLIAKLTLLYPCKPLENGLSRILYTWILLDVFLTFVRPKDVIRLKIRLFILCMYCCVKHNNT